MTFINTWPSCGGNRGVNQPEVRRLDLPCRTTCEDPLPVACAHLIASGLIGEPTAPVIGSGGAVKKNS